MWKSQTYNFNFWRVVNVFLVTFLILILLLYFINEKKQSNKLDVTFIIACIFMFAFFCLLDIIIFIQHFKFLKNVKFIAHFQNYELHQSNLITLFTFDEVEKVTQYGSYRNRLSRIKVYKFQLKDKVFYISSLTISPENVSRYFENKIDSNLKVFPFMPKNIEN